MLGLTLLLLAAPPDPASLARKAVVDQFERKGRSNPLDDAALDQAAKELAQKALDTSAAEAADLLTLTAALSRAGGFDPTPRALLLKGSPAEEPLKSLRARGDLADEPVTHLGVGAAQRGDKVALCVLLAERRAEVEAFPRHLGSHPKPERLCATLKDGYQSADLFVTRPDGEVEKQPMRHDKASQRVCADVALGGDGRYTVELLARGEFGPQVAALFFVQVGAKATLDAAASFQEPTQPDEAKARLTLAINNLRKGFGFSPLTRDEQLDAIAQAWDERLASENFFAHVAPDGEDLKGRLRKAGYHYRTAGENLGLASGPLAAHFSIEHSPGHRKNLLEPAYSKIGRAHV